MPGTIMVASTMENSSLSPRNFSRAKANAAGMLIASLPAVVIVEMPKLFQNHCATGK